MNFSGVLHSDISDVSPFFDSNRSIKDASTSDTINVTISGSSTELWGFISEPGFPGNSSWEDGGTWSVTLRVVTGNTFVRARCLAVRIDSSGNLLQTGTFTSFQTLTSGNKNYTISNPLWNDGEEDSGNRIAILVSINNMSPTSQSVTLGTNTTTEKVETNISTILTEGGYINNFICGSVDSQASSDLFTYGYTDSQASVDLFMHGHNAAANFVDLLIGGSDSTGISGDLFVDGFDNVIASKNLFVNGQTDSEITTDFFITGHREASGFISLAFFAEGGSLSIYDNLPLIVNGLRSRPEVSCPIIDPTASIQISSDLIDIYQSRIDALINQLGKNVYLEFTPIREPCPNCEYDTMRKRSTGVYKTGGPRPFARGLKCPYCKGRGFTETPVNKCIKCLIKWNPEDAKNYGISVSKMGGIVRLKTYLTEADDLSRAQTVIVNHDIVNQMKLKVKLVQGPVPVGLREDRYCISFWELI